MEKELENPEKNEKIKQPSQPKSAQPGRAPAPSNRRTPLVSGSSPSRAPSLPRSLPSGVDLSAPVFLGGGRGGGGGAGAGGGGGGGDLSAPVFLPTPPPTLSLSLSVSRAWIASRRAIAPCTPFFSLCVVGLLFQFRPLRARRGPARAHSRTSPDFSTTTPAHAPSSLLRAPPVPHAHPSPHFAQLH
jgi:hypothetical protein